MLVDDADLENDSVFAPKNSATSRRHRNSALGDVSPTPAAPPGTILTARSMDLRPAHVLNDDNVVALLDSAAQQHPRWWSVDGPGDALDPCVFLG